MNEITAMDVVVRGKKQSGVAKLVILGYDREHNDHTSESQKIAAFLKTSLPRETIVELANQLIASVR